MDAARKKIKQLLLQLSSLIKNKNTVQCNFSKKQLKEFHRLVNSDETLLTTEQFFILQHRFFNEKPMSICRICCLLYISPAKFYTEQNIALTICYGLLNR